MTTPSPLPSDASIGMQLAQRGRPADALPYLDRANRNAPMDVPVLHALAGLLHASGRHAEAIERYRHAADIAPNDIGILAGWARALLLSGDSRSAQGVLEKALDADLRFADAGGLLEAVLHESGDADAACSLLQAMLDRQPLHPALLAQYAKALLAAERLDEAQAAYERYRQLRPEEPLPWVELGRLAVSRGDSAQALAYFQSALDIAPGYAAALWELAQVQGWQVDVDLLAQVRSLTECERDPRALAGLHDLLSRCHDRATEFAAAAMHAERTNALLKQIVPPRSRYASSRHEAEIEATIGRYTPQLFQRLRSAGSRQRRPVFVIGLPRSGTTLLEQMLASHPGIVGVGEQAIAGASLQRALAPSRGSLASLQPVAVAEAAGWHLQALQERMQRLRIDADAERVVDKLPDNYLLAGWLRIAFPEAAIIHCLRDPRDVALSCWLTQFADQPWSLDLPDIVHRIEQHRRLMRHWRACIGDRLTELRYERLVADPEAELRRALAAIGLEWHPQMLVFAERKGFVSSASRQQVREGLHARSIGRWRNYQQALEPIMPRLHAIAAQDTADAVRHGEQ